MTKFFLPHGEDRIKKASFLRIRIKMWWILLWKCILVDAQPFPLVFQNKCIEDLGCFYNGPPFFDAIHRPISVLPDHSSRTQFLLFTRANPKTSFQIDLTDDSVTAAPINPELEMKILVHGYSVKLNEKDSRYLMKDELLEHENFNVIIVDWSEHNQFPYFQAVANARVIGAKIAKLLELCKRLKGLDFGKVHIIGHSLGAHIAGWAAEKLDRVARISGLDPAGPYFQHAPDVVRLDRTDAHFVDIIHTNGGRSYVQGLGLHQNIGHMDFYPNGGNHQPGCSNNEAQSFEQLIANSCDHSRANTFFLDSINKCDFLSVQCKTYEEFQSKECTRQNSRTSVMGLHAKKLIGLKGLPTFFLETSSVCKTNYSSFVLMGLSIVQS